MVWDVQVCTHIDVQSASAQPHLPHLVRLWVDCSQVCCEAFQEEQRNSDEAVKRESAMLSQAPK